MRIVRGGECYGDSLVVCSGECCGNSLVVGRCGELGKLGEHHVKPREAGNNL